MHLLFFALIAGAHAITFHPQGNSDSMVELGSATGMESATTYGSVHFAEMNMGAEKPPKSVDELLSKVTSVQDRIKLLPKATSKWISYGSRFSKKVSDGAWQGSLKLDEEAKQGALLNKLKNKHVVFLGDSVTRYQYLNLAHHLLHGKAPEKPFFFYHEASEWNSWFPDSNQRLQSDNGHEICDCWRGDPSKGQNFVENRFLEMPKANVSVTYLPWLDSKHSFTAHWTPDQGYPIQTGCRPGACDASSQELQTLGSHGEEGTIAFLKNYVMKLKPTPTHIVMNRGLWGRDLTEQGIDAIFAAGEELKKAHPHTTFIWKTTNSDLLDVFPELHGEDSKKQIKHAEEHGWKILDLFDASKNVESWYVDNFHVNEQASAYFNSLLLNLL